jgi:glycosyltransferase
MRILFAALGQAHVPWLVPLAWAAQLSGHEVRVAARPQCVGQITAAGLVAVPVGTDDAAPPPADWGKKARVADGWTSRPELLGDQLRAALAERQFAIADTMLDDLVGFGRWWRPDVVVYDTACVAGLVAAAALGTPAIGHTWGVALGITYPEGAELPDGYTRLFTRFGAEPVSGDPVWIDPCPPSLRLPHAARRLDMRYLPYNGSGTVPAWLAQEPPPARPRALITGGITTDSLAALLDRTVSVLGDLDFDVVVAVAAGSAGSVGSAGSAGSVPSGPGVRVAESVPLNALLPTCQLVVHHGGNGTGMTALTFGLPQLVLPQTPFQQHWAARVNDAGVGLALDAAGQADPAALKGALAELTRPGYAERSAAVRAEIAAMPHPAELVPVLEQL